jgi:hypothetical protein
MNRNTKHYVRKLIHTQRGKKKKKRSKSRESGRRRRAKHSIHIFSKDVLE